MKRNPNPSKEGFLFLDFIWIFFSLKTGLIPIFFYKCAYSLYSGRLSQTLRQMFFLLFSILVLSFFFPTFFFLFLKICFFFLLSLLLIKLFSFFKSFSSFFFVSSFLSLFFFLIPLFVKQTHGFSDSLKDFRGLLLSDEKVLSKEDLSNNPLYFLWSQISSVSSESVEELEKFKKDLRQVFSHQEAFGSFLRVAQFFDASPGERFALFFDFHYHLVFFSFFILFFLSLLGIFYGYYRGHLDPLKFDFLVNSSLLDDQEKKAIEIFHEVRPTKGENLPFEIERMEIRDPENKREKLFLRKSLSDALRQQSFLHFSLFLKEIRDFRTLSFFRFFHYLEKISNGALFFVPLIAFLFFKGFLISGGIGFLILTFLFALMGFEFLIRQTKVDLDLGFFLLIMLGLVFFFYIDLVRYFTACLFVVLGLIRAHWSGFKTVQED